MAHLMKTSPRHSLLPVLWNVDGSVGVGGVNSAEDVYLVQYILNLTGKSPRISNVEIRAKLSALQVTGKCDAYTIECIKYGQTLAKEMQPGTVVDGRVSRASSSGTYSGGGYAIANFNLGYRRCYWENWPCISMDGDCSAITGLVYRELYGTPAPI